MSDRSLPYGGGGYLGDLVGDHYMTLVPNEAEREQIEHVGQTFVLIAIALGVYGTGLLILSAVARIVKHGVRT